MSVRLTFFRGCHFIIFVNQNWTALRSYMRMECRFKEIQSASHAASRLPSFLQQIFSKKRCMMMCESQLCGNFRGGGWRGGGQTAQSTQITHWLNPQLSSENKSETHGVDWQCLRWRFPVRKSKVRVRYEPAPSSAGAQDRRLQDQSALCIRKNVFLNFSETKSSPR